LLGTEGSFKNLKSLELYDVQIETLPDLSELTELKSLSISGADFTKLYDESVNWENIVSLNINSTNIHSIDKEIVIVIGAVLIITAIVITGFTSLVPLLTFLGLSVKLATVVSVTVCGIAFLASSIYLLGYPLNILGKIFKSDTLKTISFGLRHPIISLQIGKVKPGVGNTNISTNASRFANAFDFEDNDAQEGSEVNAFRHTFWISIITSKWGENIGLQVGNAHEKNQNVIHEIKDIYSHKFKTLSDADQAVDLLNNVIGRKIGKTTSIDSTSKDIAKKVLDYYYTNGLNIVKETDDGHYVIVKERLSYERYKDDLIILETLDENGFPPDNKYYNKKGD